MALVYHFLIIINISDDLLNTQIQDHSTDTDD